MPRTVWSRSLWMTFCRACAVRRLPSPPPPAKQVRLLFTCIAWAEFAHRLVVVAFWLVLTVLLLLVGQAIVRAAWLRAAAVSRPRRQPAWRPTSAATTSNETRPMRRRRREKVRSCVCSCLFVFSCPPHSLLLSWSPVVSCGAHRFLRCGCLQPAPVRASSGAAGRTARTRLWSRARRPAASRAGCDAGDPLTGQPRVRARGALSVSCVEPLPPLINSHRAGVGCE